MEVFNSHWQATDGKRCNLQAPDFKDVFCKKKMPTTKRKAVSSNPTCLFTPSESEIQSHLFQANKTLHFFLAEVNGSECEDLFSLSLN